MNTENHESIEMRVEEDVDLGFGFKDSMLPIWCIGGGGGEGIFEALDIVWVGEIISKFYMGHSSMKTNYNADIGYVMSLKWSWVR